MTVLDRWPRLAFLETPQVLRTRGLVRRKFAFDSDNGAERAHLLADAADYERLADQLEKGNTDARRPS